MARFSLGDTATSEKKRVGGLSYRVSVLCVQTDRHVELQERMQATLRGRKIPVPSHVQVFVDSPLLGIANEGFNGLQAWRYEADMHLRLLIMAGRKSLQDERYARQTQHIRQQLQHWALPFQVVHVGADGAWLERVCDSVLHGWQRFNMQNATVGEQQKNKPELQVQTQAETQSAASGGWQAWCDCCLDPASERALFNKKIL